jgi:plasmid stabilization system protein ParE
MKIRWYKNAVKNLLSAIEYLENNNAKDYSEQLEKEILSTIRLIAKTPHIYPEDRFKNNNDGSYRAFVIDSYRITYRITSTDILILRIKHTSRKPIFYKR